jgi:hypothetical protein
MEKKNEPYIWSLLKKFAPGASLHRLRMQNECSTNRNAAFDNLELLMSDQSRDTTKMQGDSNTINACSWFTNKIIWSTKAEYLPSA